MSPRAVTASLHCSFFLHSTPVQDLRAPSCLSQLPPQATQRPWPGTRIWGTGPLPIPPSHRMFHPPPLPFTPAGPSSTPALILATQTLTPLTRPRLSLNQAPVGAVMDSVGMAGMTKTSSACSSGSEPVRLFVQYNRILYLTSYITFMGTYLALVCSTSARRRYPTNLILLGIFTLAMSYMAGMLASYHNTKVVMLCIGITAMVCLAVTLFCFQTKFDFTSCHGLMFSLMMVLLLTGLLLVFTAPFGYIPWLQTAYAGLGALVFTVSGRKKG
ncbi:protein lifeguard 2a isoform X3 [Polyodon spathula]|uniref:protein lifeguard 2a isoform X3 n=1 Tax=Polyodon spathula TaxID=7913 RepID=UPI001B7DA301|nr:protein lifeguard 2a isoform X3 [Polyodon spathula]